MLAFGLLIFYHTGMLYVTWPYHVKSPRIAAGVEWAMVLTNPWRLALLFFISGVASRFLLGKLGAGTLRARPRDPAPARARLRDARHRAAADVLRARSERGRWSGGYLSFWIEHYLRADPTLGVIMPTWNHLWFLVYLLVYCLGFAAARRGLARAPRASSARSPSC